jgi:hypothetical protein
MDPESSKGILGELHQLLQELDLSTYKLKFNKGGPDPYP